MKLKEIFNLCKDNKSIAVYSKPDDDSGRNVYISNHFALYPAFGLPPLHDDVSALLTIFDVPLSQHDSWTVNYEPLPNTISVADVVDNEKQVDVSPIQLIHRGHEIKSFYTDTGMITINSEYLAPLKDEMKNDIQYYVRQSYNGATHTQYIVVKVGFMLRAVILPCKIINDEFFNNTREFNRQVMLTHKNNTAQQSGVWEWFN